MTLRISKLKKLIFAILAFAIVAPTWAPIAYADHNDDETVIVLEQIDYDPLPIVVAMRDTEVVLRHMAGILDRYDGVGHPDDCNDFVTYMIILSLLSFILLIETLFAPSEWQDVGLIAAEAPIEAFIANESIFYHCQNGRDDSISEHNLAAGRDGIQQSLEKLRTAIHASAERMGVDPESIQSGIEVVLNQPIDPTEIAIIAEEFGLDWDAELFYEDLRITGAFLDTLGGWLDRLIAGETVGCGEYIINMELALGPVPFLVVEDVWQPLFDEHIAILNTMFDTNKEIVDVCLNGGNISEFMVFKAREGIAQAQDRLHALKQETERRLDITPQ